jgi:hypothetical protein
VILKKNSCKAILNKKNACTNKLGGKISCPSIWWGKNVAKQHGCRDRFDQFQKIAGLIFRD